MNLLVVCRAVAALLASATMAPSPLPALSGPYAVGTRVLTPIADASRPDVRFASGKRTVLVQLWYPTNRSRGDFSRYVPEPWLIDYLKRESSAPAAVDSWRHLKTRAYLAAPAADGRFPLILFSQGMGMLRFNYTSWLEELASLGLIIASIDHPGIVPIRLNDRVVEGGAVSGDPAVPARRVSEMAADIDLVRATLLRSAGKLHIDTRKVAVVGHSLGGAAALESCRTNPSIGACVDIDGDAWGTVEKEGVGKPFLLVLNEPIFTDADLASRGGSRERLTEMGQQRRAQWKELIAKQSAPAILVLVKGTNHLSFTDAPFIRRELVADGGGTLTDPTRTLTITSGLIAAYIRNSLAGTPNLGAPPDDFITVVSLRDW
jgi:dienelactone hydrolase